MKKIPITLAILLITSLGFTQDFHIGAKGGVNFANQKGGENDSDSKSRTAYHVGLVGELSLSEKFSLQGELLYSALGSNGETTTNVIGGSYTEKAEIKSSYLSFPILGKYYIIKGLSIEAGPQFSYLLSADYDTSLSDTNGNNANYSFDIKDDTKSLDIGLAIGSYYKLDFGLFFGLRYVAGLSKMYDGLIEFDYDNTTVIIDPGDNKNQVFQASIGYFFN